MAYDKLIYGNVLDGADLGPVIDMAAKREIDKKIAFLANGFAEIVYQKTITPSPSGQDVAPTILLADNDAIRNKVVMQTLLDTEIFGPVFTLVPFRSIDEVDSRDMMRSRSMCKSERTLLSIRRVGRKERNARSAGKWNYMALP